MHRRIPSGRCPSFRCAPSQWDPRPREPPQALPAAVGPSSRALPTLGSEYTHHSHESIVEHTWQTLRHQIYTSSWGHMVSI